MALANNSLNSGAPQQASVSKGSSSGSSSPWDEELPPPEEPAEKVVGTLTPGKAVSIPTTPDSFVVPKNVEETAGPSVVRPDNFPKAIAQAAPKRSNPVPAKSVDQNPSLPPAQASSAGNPQPTAQPPAQATQSTPSAKTAVPPVLAIQPETFNYGSDFVSKPVPSSGQPVQISPAAPAKVIADITPAPVKSLKSEQIETETEPAVPGNGIANKPAASKWAFLRRKTAKSSPLKEEETDLPDPAGVTETAPPKALVPDFGRHLKIIGGIAIVIVFFSLLTWLTEIGILSLGLEKVYGAIGIERLWGGLPVDTDKALARSLYEMRNHPDFKVTGSLEVTVDKSKQSPITSPLISQNALPLAGLTRAIFVATDVDGEEWPDEILEDEGFADESPTAPAILSDPPASSAATTSTPSSTSVTTPVQTDTESYQPYQNIGSAVKDLYASVDGFIGQVGSEMNVTVTKVIGNSQITLKNQEDKLWVKSADVKFAENAEKKWLEYPLKSFSEKTVTEAFLTAQDNGLTVLGQRIGNEKIGRFRTFHYRIDELTAGNSLDLFGLSKDSLQSVAGDIWIDVKEKVIRKAELKITLSPSYSVTKLTAKLEFGEYDVVNTFTKPPESETIDPNAVIEAVPPAGVEESVPAVDSIALNDAKRKADLAAVQKALELYKGYYYSYPKSAALLKLNTAGNVLEQLLTPGYIASLPKDPKESESWFYGYKSADGKTYQLSARLENQSDPTGVKAGDLYLYFLSNQ